MKKMMQAAVFRQSKGLLIEEASIPEFDDDQVLVKVSNTGFCGSDHSMIKSGGLPDGTILGHEMSGIVFGVGRNVKDVAAGKRVVIRPTYCGGCIDCRSGKPYFCQNDRRTIGIGDLPGAFAEYVTVYPQMLIDIPTGVDSRNAALAEVFATSLHAIECVGRHTRSALVVGGGPIGLALVRLLKILDFYPVILSEPVKAKRELGLSLGAHQAIDPHSADLNQTAFQSTQGRGFEVVFECAGVPALIPICMDAAARGGTVCVVSVMYESVPINPITLSFKELWLTGSYSNTHEENKQCLQWMRAGKLDGKILITDLISLEELPRVYDTRIDTGEAIKVMLQIGDEF